MEQTHTWVYFALVSAIAAAATAVLAKIGVEAVPSTLAMAIRTLIVVVFACAMVFVGGESPAIRDVPARSWLFLLLSGVGTGVSWLAYFRALQLGPASRVAPIDKLSLPLTLVLAAVFLHEAIAWRVAVGVVLMTIGALLTI